MTIEPGQIDQIVREVLRQMLTQQSLANDASPLPLPLPMPTPMPTTGRSDESERQAGTLVLSERIVTAELLRGRLIGVTCVQVPTRAIVTPLVADLLRAQAIRLERASAASQASPPAMARWGWFVDPLEASIGNDGWPPPRVGIAWVACQNAQELFELFGATHSGVAVSRAVAITSDWARLVWQANRRPSIRAAAVSSVPCVDQAICQINPNLLVINRSQLSSQAITALLDRFVNHVRGN